VVVPDTPGAAAGELPLCTLEESGT